MALSLERVQKTSRKKERPQPKKKATTRRPWQSLHDPLSFAPLLEYSFNDEFNTLPEDLDTSSSRDLLKLLLKFHVSQKMRSLRKNSYLLARMTYAESWWARLKLYPRFRFPIPSWLTQNEQS